MAKAIAVKRKHKINGKSSSSYTRKDLIFYICLLALPMLQVIIFYFYVNFSSFGMAFQSYDSVTGEFSWGIQANLDTLKLYSGYLGQWALNSVIVWLVTSVVGTVLAVIFSFYIYKRRTLSNFFKFILFLPSVVPAILLGLMFKYFASSALPAYSQGSILNVFDTIGLTKAVGATAAAQIRFWVLTLYTVWISFGSQVLIYTGAMDQIPTEIIEAGRLDGAGFGVELKSIVFPCIISSVGTFLISGVAGLFTNQNNLFNIMGMNSNVMENEKTIGYFLYSYLVSNPGMTGYTFTSFIGLICTVIVVPISLLIRKGVERVQQ